MLKVILFILLIFNFGCGKAPVPQQYNSAPSDNLTEVRKPQHHLLCTLRINGKIYDDLHWHSADGHTLLRLINYSIKKDKKVILVKIPGPVSDTGRLRLLIRRDSRDVMWNGSVHEAAKYKERILIENMEEILLSGPGEEFSCLLKHL